MTLRSMTKRALRTGLDLAAFATVHWPRSPASRILTYHEILPGRTECPNPYNQVSAASLDRQIGALARSGYRFLTASQLADELAAPSPTPDGKSICLTFDDGLEAHCSLALPVLARHRAVATFYVLTGFFSQPARTGSRSGRHLSEEEIGKLAEAGMEIGSHGRTHAILSRLDHGRVEEEVAGSSRDIQRAVGRAPRTFAYPYGSRATYHEDVIRSVRSAGYECAVSTIIGANRAGAPRFELRRIPVYGTDSDRVCLARARGAYDWTGSMQELWLGLMPHHSTSRRNA
jgi:peptidoglycan/xylan/chitin deacetylase (PgdA/CDA1 family)